MNQTTLKKQFLIDGVGLHTGQSVQMIVKPAQASTGYRFKRTDLDNQSTIKADVKYVLSTKRGTCIGNGDARVQTIEHILSALRGMDIDNALIEVDGPEIPILDGSAGIFTEAIAEVGIEDLDKEREYLIIEEPVQYKDEETGSEYLALPANRFEITSLIDFNSQVLGQQYAYLFEPDEYREQIAPARTFVFLHELEALLEEGLIKGGDLDNAVVIVDRVMKDDELDALAKKLDKPDIKVKKRGILNTTDLRFKNEPARHKLLDVIGDLSLIGRPIKGKIVATKPGHTSNVRFAQKLKKILQVQQKLRGKPIYDPNQEPVKDVMEIMRTLPHRFPFLLIDKITELTDTQVVGIKNVTINEHCFQGHFPDNPVFPGVLQIEALAQTGGILALSTVPDPENWDTYFLKIDNTKFKAKVTPGDTLILKMRLMSPIRRGICHMYGTAYVGNRIVSEGELIAQIVRRQVEE